MSNRWWGTHEEAKARIEDLPDLSEQLQMKWASGWWDGMLSGYAELDGAPGYWVECAADDWEQRSLPVDEVCTGTEGSTGCEDYEPGGSCCNTFNARLYLVFRLDAEQDRIERANHALFQEHVGTHFDYEDGDRNHSGVKPEAGWRLFYNAEKPTPSPLRESQIVGWMVQ